jgi:hypothetical protein
LSRREKLFWLCVGAALVVLFLSLIPAHYEICEISEKTKDEHCASYQVAQFLGIKIPQFLDRMGGVLTALATVAIAAFTLTLKRATDRLWDAGERQIQFAGESSATQSHDMQASIKAAAESAKAANRSAEVAENALIATDRAWISIKAKIIGPLTFKDGFVAINVRFDMTNVGKSPATHAELFAQLGSDLIEARDIAAEAMLPIGRELFDYGVVLFPTDTSDRDFYLRLPIAKFKESIARAIKLIADSKSIAVPMTVASPAIMVCAYYRLGSSHDHPF